MAHTIEIADRQVGKGHPVFIVAEIGINHNGDLNLARRLIDAAVVAGCDAVKFQKRTPEICVPLEQRNQMRDTPWGYISYMDYRRRMEFGVSEFKQIDSYCRERNLLWFASCWDQPSVDFMEGFEPPCYKIASASLADLSLLKRVAETGRPVILSTGMSTIAQIEAAVGLLETKNLLITHCTSTYPCSAEELNLSMIATLAKKFACPIGYSGHEVGLQATVAAVALGAVMVERHITLDRAMWGSDQAASVEPGGFMRLVRDIRIIEKAIGDGVKRIYESELPILQRLRNVS
jgi:N-acetylneuraminate synthase